MDNYFVIDVEADGFLDTATVLYCLCWYKSDGRTGSITDYDTMRRFLLQPDVVFICHNSIRFDKPLLERLLGITIQNKFIDTLGLSWYLYPNRQKHGLESWGEDFGVPKPKIKDWKNQPIEVYVNRCTEDVRINTLLWLKMWDYLMKIYDGYPHRFINYISFKLDCAAEQERVKWKVDVQRCQTVLATLLVERDAKVATLRSAMPEDVTYKDISKPAKMLKKDGTLSSAGVKWKELLEEIGEDNTEIESIKIITKIEPGNPASQTQLKNWLYDLGWVPITYVMRKNKDHAVKRVAQITNGNEICESVKLLYDKEPALIQLEGLFILNHRISILEGFLENRDANNFLQAQIKGFTNTLRFQHTTIVNLPTIHKPYGKDIRGCLIAPDADSLLCGSDMSSLEDSTKQHYMHYYDPEYVKEMRTEGFDPHLMIGTSSKMITLEEEKFYKWYNQKKS